MSAAMIAQLIIALGPTALDLIPKLTAVWDKPKLTTEEVIGMCAPAAKSYADYIAAAQAAKPSGTTTV